MSHKRHIEPLLWSLFGAGGAIIAFAFPALILVVGLGVPLEIIPASALSYERVSEFILNNWIGKIALMAILIPSYWACIHRIYHGSHDFGFHPSIAVKVLCYGGTLILSGVTAFLLLV
ncbi:MAG: fumarate reductase subunit D [Candidatus Endonucleobacter bathymodioli]|uniref:Fumarate reductase subunit D n=1 Tax=Candidatus Endonucleibacter bathymodioli TaxID=539814 RepID=A0AA90NLD4_9GAMM|nr:fumarate reductase subunit D [Candidatus Endonucleobacter bathymodioli]